MVCWLLCSMTSYASLTSTKLDYYVSPIDPKVVRWLPLVVMHIKLYLLFQMFFVRLFCWFAMRSDMPSCPVCKWFHFLLLLCGSVRKWNFSTWTQESVNWPKGWLRPTRLTSCSSGLSWAPQSRTACSSTWRVWTFRRSTVSSRAPWRQPAAASRRRWTLAWSQCLGTYWGVWPRTGIASKPGSV